MHTQSKSRPLAAKFVRAAIALAVIGTVGLVGTPSAQAVVGRDWTARNPLPSGEDIFAVVGTAQVASQAPLVVAVGAHGLILTSPSDGSAWTKQTSGVTSDLNDVLWSGAMYVAVGLNSTVLTSPDGVNWTKKYTTNTALPGTDNLLSVTWTGSRFIVVGGNATTGVVFSWDAQVASSWVKGTPGVTDHVTGIVSAGSGSTILAITPKAILAGTMNAAGLVTFAKKAPTSGVVLTSDAPASITLASGSAFLLSTRTIAGGACKVWRSTNGNDWTAKTLTGLTSSVLFLRSTGQDVTAAGSAGDFWTSPDGNAWTQRATGQAQILFSGGRGASSPNPTYIGVGEGGRIFTSVPVVSSAWTSRYSSGSTGNLEGAASNGTAFVGVGNGFTLTSPTGTVWTEQTQTGKDIRGIVHTGSQYVGVGKGCWTSPDGITLTETMAPVANEELNRALFAGGRVYAVGFDSTPPATANRSLIYSSATGASWTKATTPATAMTALNGIAATASGGLLVAVGNSTGTAGLVLTSPDFGVTWTKRAVTLVAGENLTDVTFGNNLFMAVTNKGGIWTSSNGVTWTKRRASSAVGFNRIVAVGNQFIALGDAGHSAWSFGGTAWTDGDLGTSQNMTDAAFNGTVLAAVGEVGAVLTSDSGPPSRPTVSFGLASATTQEDAGIVNVALNLTPASTVPVTVLFTVGGSATSVADYTLVSTPITFAVGEVTKNIAVTIKKDTIDEANETLTLSLGAPTGDAVLGTNKVHTLTIIDLFPTFTAQPVNQLVVAGTTAVMNATVGSAPSMVGTWKKNGGAAAGLVAKATPSAVASTGSITNGSAALTCSNAGLRVGMAVSGSGIPANTSVIAITATGVTMSANATATNASVSVTFSAVTSLANCLTTISNTTITCLNTAGILVGATVTGTNIPAGATVQSITSSTAFVLSLSATGTVAAPGVTLTFAPPATPAGTFPLAFDFTGTMANVQTTQAGAYTLSIASPTGSKVSDIAQLGVVENTPAILPVLADTTVILTAKAAGNGLTYQWLRDGQEIHNSADLRVTGTNTVKLTVKNVDDSDTGVYACRVTQTTAGGQLTQNAATTSVYVQTSVPVVTTSSMPSTTVGEIYSLTPTTAGFATSWSISGLPPGLTPNPVTGQITGKAAQAGDFSVTFTAVNGLGSSPSVIIPLHVNPLPANAIGTFYALIDRSVNVNQNLGAYLEVTTAASGSVTGKLFQGAVITNFTGSMTYVSGVPLLTAAIAIAPVTPASPAGLPVLPAVTLNFVINPTSNLFSGNVAAGANSVAFNGTPVSKWASSPVPSDKQGLYNFVINPPSTTPSQALADKRKPLGFGFGSFTVPANGLLTIAGHTADGNAYTRSGAMSVGPLAVTLSTTIGSTTATLASPSFNIFPGMPIGTHAGVATGTTVATVVNTTTITLSAAATGTATGATTIGTGASQQIMMYVGNFNTLASMHGVLDLAVSGALVFTDTDNGNATTKEVKVSGSLTWLRGAEPDQSTVAGHSRERFYRTGFKDPSDAIVPLTYTADGGHYFKQPNLTAGPPASSGIIMNLSVNPNNARFDFLYGSLLDTPTRTSGPSGNNPDSAFTLDAPATVTSNSNGAITPNPTFNINTGRFDGTFSILDADPFGGPNPVARSNIAYHGIAIRHYTDEGTAILQRGYGYFVLPLLPQSGIVPDGSKTDPATNSPKLSGQIIFHP